MSETDIPIKAPPPRDVLIAQSNGFTKWQPDFASIVVDQLPNGKRLTVTLYGGHSHAFELDGAQATWLATLLMRDA